MFTKQLRGEKKREGNRGQTDRGWEKKKRK